VSAEGAIARGRKGAGTGTGDITGKRGTRGSGDVSGWKAGSAPEEPPGAHTEDRDGKGSKGTEDIAGSGSKGTDDAAGRGSKGIEDTTGEARTEVVAGKEGGPMDLSADPTISPRISSSWFWSTTTIFSFSTTSLQPLSAITTEHVFTKS
jgi:hypothetical protein